MSILDTFWDAYDAGAAELEGVQTVDAVIAICGKHFGKSSGDAFFPGGSGDVELLEVLVEAGWTPVWVEADYYFAVRQPDGQDGLTYVEGDISRGVQKPVP